MEDRAKNTVHVEALLSGLDDGFISSSMGDLYKVVLETIERPLLERILARTFGNQLKAAKILGISRNTLRSKIIKFGINTQRWKI